MSTKAVGVTPNSIGNGEAVSKECSEKASVGDAVVGGVEVTIIASRADEFWVLVNAPIVVMVAAMVAMVIAINAAFRRVGLVISATQDRITLEY